MLWQFTHIQANELSVASDFADCTAMSVCVQVRVIANSEVRYIQLKLRWWQPCPKPLYQEGALSIEFAVNYL